MNYPTLDEVDAASREQICRWYRFLPSPGWSASDAPLDEFRKTADQESAVLDRVVERFNEFGGMTPEISKAIGLEP